MKTVKPENPKRSLTLLISILVPMMMVGEACLPDRVVHEFATADYTIEYWLIHAESIGGADDLYSFEVTLTPTLSGAGNVSAVASTTSPDVDVEAGDLFFGDVEPNLAAGATSLLQIRQDRTQPFDPGEIDWDVSFPAQAPYDFSAFAAEMEAWLAEDATRAGAGVILVDTDDGVIFKRSFGSFTDDRAYLVASTSKMISAGVLLALQDQGLLDMDAPVNDVVDWGDEHNPEITPAMLVGNSSGLIGLSPLFSPYLCQYYYFLGYTLQACAQTIFTTPADDPPGPGDDPDKVAIAPPDTEFRYGGGQWQVAGAVAEVASGKSWDQLVQEIYVDPCGLDTFGYNNHFLQLAGDSFSYPIGFDGDPSVLLPTENPNMEGGLFTTIGAYGKVLLMHLRGGLCGQNEVLSEAAVATLHTDRLLEIGISTAGPGTGGGGYGYGWWMERGPGRLLTDPGAYGSTAWLDEERGYAGLIIIESNAGEGGALFSRVLPFAESAFDAAHAAP